MAACDPAAGVDDEPEFFQLAESSADRSAQGRGQLVFKLVELPSSPRGDRGEYPPLQGWRPPFRNHASSSASIAGGRHRERGRRRGGSRARSVSAGSNSGRRGSVGPIDLEVREGEVIGLAGLLGSGRTETMRLLFGVDRRDSGEIVIKGRPA